MVELLPLIKYIYFVAMIIFNLEQKLLSNGDVKPFIEQVRTFNDLRGDNYASRQFYRNKIY